MTPRAFNDGFCYKNYTNSVTVAPSKAYEICYWSSGWNGYNVASAKTLSSNGYKLINTNGDYYWVLGLSLIHISISLLKPYGPLAQLVRASGS